MKKIICLITATSLFLTSCEDSRKNTSDQIQQDAQEKMLKEANMQIGMPGIKNFQERKLLKLILEMRDREGLVTYSYMENMIPAIVPGHTALGGKLTFIGTTVGFGIPYATQFTSPMKVECAGMGKTEPGYAWLTTPQADPNGLFSPASADGTWILMKNPNGPETTPQYIEPKIAVFTFKLPMDGSPAEKK